MTAPSVPPSLLPVYFGLSSTWIATPADLFILPEYNAAQTLHVLLAVLTAFFLLHYNAATRARAPNRASDVCFIFREESNLASLESISTPQVHLHPSTPSREVCPCR